MSPQLSLTLSDEGGALVHGMGISELALALQCLHALGLTWRSITTDNTSGLHGALGSVGGALGGGALGNLGLVSLREHMIRVYHTSLLDTEHRHPIQNKGLENGLDSGLENGLGKGLDKRDLFFVNESQEARSLREAMVAIGTLHSLTCSNTSVLQQ